MKVSITAITLSIAALANAHGYFVSPEARRPGEAFTKDCGAQANSLFSSDINGNIQGLLQVVSSRSDFNPKKCK